MGDHRIHGRLGADRGELPTCPVCVDTMVAAEASVFYVENEFVGYLWACETCGYGFVTKHALKRPACN